MPTLKGVGLLAVGALLLSVSGCANFDFVPPAVVVTSPADGSTNVALDSAITATFSEALNPSSVNTGTFTLTSGHGVVAGNVSFSGLSATLTPATPLSPNTLYTATLTTGVKDFSGNDLDSSFSWRFTTDSAVPTVSFTAAGQSVSEGVGAVTVTVILSNASVRQVDVPFFVSGSATYPNDHDLVDGTLSVPAGALMATLSFNVVNDNLDEPNETVLITLGTPLGATVGAPFKHTVTINDDDPPSVAWAINGQTVNESSACPCALTVSARLSSPSASEVTLPYTVTGTATVGSDFSTPAPNPLVIAAGSLSADVLFNVIDDVQTESSEFIILTLAVPTNATLGTTVQHSIEIIDDE